MAERLRIFLEFNKQDIKDLELYRELLKFSNPAGIVKDILKGLVPLSVLKNDKE